ALVGLSIGEEHRLVVTLHDDFILEPDAWDQRRARCVVLHRGLIRVQMPDSVTCLDLVNRAGAVLVQTVGFRSDAIEILARVSDSIVIDLDLEARNHWLPSRIIRIESGLIRSAPLQFVGREVQLRIGKTEEYTAIVFRWVEDLELRPQREIAKGFRRIEEQAQASITVADHLTVYMRHATAAGAGEAPPGEGRCCAIKQRAEAGFWLRADDRVRTGKHACIQQVGGAARERDAREHRVWRAAGREQRRAGNIAIRRNVDPAE